MNELSEKTDLLEYLDDEVKKKIPTIDISIDGLEPIEVVDDTPYLESTFSKIVNQIFSKLDMKYGESLGQYLALTNKIYLDSIKKESLFYQLGIEYKIFNANDSVSALATLDGYEKNKGRANILDSVLSSTALIDKIEERYSLSDIKNDMLEMMGIYWLNQADKLIERNKIYDLVLIGDGISAIHLSKNYDLWEYGHQVSTEERSLNMSKNAKKAHAETYSIKEDIRKYCIENKINLDNISAAARKIDDKKLANISLKTIGIWLTEFKKEQ